MSQYEELGRCAALLQEINDLRLAQIDGGVDWPNLMADFSAREYGVPKSQAQWRTYIFLRDPESEASLRFVRHRLEQILEAGLAREFAA